MFLVLAYVKDSPEARSYKEAMISDEKERWQEAIAIEVENLKKRCVVEEVNVPEGTDIHFIDTKYVFK